jgi:hypothetical protein
MKSIVCEGKIVCIIRGASCVSWAMKCLLLIPALVVCGWSQQPDQTQTTANTQITKHHRGAGKEIGSGAGDIGKGTAKGAGHLAEGTGKGAVDLVTLHPVKGATSLGKGAGAAGKDAGAGAVKGTGKIGKGIGKAIKHIF